MNALGWLLLAVLFTSGLFPGRAFAEGAFRFVVAGHLRGNDNGELNPWIDELVKAIVEEDPQAVFLTGDLIWGGYHDERVDRDVVAREWDSLEETLAPVGAPLYLVPGNHDINDPVTAEVFRERFGQRPAALRLGEILFLLLDSTRYEDVIPTPPRPSTNTRTDALASDQIAWIERVLTEHDDARQVFVLLHHVLWWEKNAAWWSEVHPILARHKVRAVFAGDYGPLKFSATARDGIQYVQSSIEGDSDLRLIRNLKMARIMNYQFENFVLVDVKGDEVDIRIRTVAALASGKMSPERFREIFAPEELTLGEKLERALGGPTRRILLTMAAIGFLFLGAAAGYAVGRRR